MSGRKFFSGNTLEQAVLLAARHFGLDPDEVEYREIKKKHGFLRTRRRFVIEVDGDSPRRSEEAAAPPAPSSEWPPAPQPESRAERVAEPRPRWSEESPHPQAEESAPVATAPVEPAPDASPPSPEPAPGLPEVPSRWSKVPEPIGEPVTPEPSPPAGREDSEPAAASEEVEVPPVQPGRRGGSRRERGRRGSGRKLTELPEAPRRARDRLAPAEGERARAAEQAMTLLFELSGVDLEAEVLRGEEGLEIEVWGTDQDLLFEDRGRLLLSYEHLLPRLIRGFTGRSIHCRVDSDSFHEIRAEQLRDLAQRIASQVQRSGRSETLEPMAPDERRIIHLTLADDPGVETASRGRGLFKRVTVSPARGGRSRRGDDRF